MAEPLFIIPARGGSKGIPRKNIRLLGGKPLLAYTAEAALRAAEAMGCSRERVVLSTDDDEISGIGRSLGLETGYRRPASLGTDSTGSREVILDVMDWADERGMAYDSVVLLQPTSPFRTSDDILGALRLYYDSEPAPDMVVSVTEAEANPYYDLFELSPEEDILRVCKGSGLITRRQDAPKVWQYNGAVYAISPRAIRAMGLGEFPCRRPYIMPRERSLDLDTPLDWLVAEALISEHRHSK